LTFVFAVPIPVRESIAVTMQHGTGRAGTLCSVGNGPFFCAYDGCPITRIVIGTAMAKETASEGFMLFSPASNLSCNLLKFLA
jgi:hypothetical protein